MKHFYNKLKSFRTAIFWQRNPKAGAFFGALFAAAIPFVGAPVLLYAIFAAPIEGSAGLFFRELLEGEIEYKFYNTLYSILILALAYAAFLHLLYAIRLFRFSFAAPASKWKAAVLGALLSPAILPLCAAKQRDWNACAMAAASMISAAAMAFIMWQKFLIPPMTQELLLLVAMAFALAAMRRLKCERGNDCDRRENTSRLLAFSPVLLCAATLLALRMYIAYLENSVDEAAAELYKSAGFEMTFDDLIAAHTNGMPTESEPYAAIFSDENHLPSIPTPWDWHKNYASNYAANNAPPWDVSAEERAAFGEYFAKNAAAIALLDEVTLRPDARPAGACEEPDDMLSYWLLFKWATLYSKRISHAQIFAQSAAAARQIMADAQRMDNLALWIESPPLLINALYAAGIRNMRAARLCEALPGLPDDALLELRAKCRRDRAADPVKFYALAMLGETLYNIRMNDELIKQSKGQPNVFSTTSFILGEIPSFVGSPFSRFCNAWLLHEKLSLLRHSRAVFERANAPLREGETRFEHMRKSAEYDRLKFRTPICRVMRLSKASACAKIFGIAETQALLDAALAVELHRRKHGALPASLDELAPEFLDAAPASVFDAAPFAYDHGFIEEFLPMSEDFTPKLLYTFNGFRICGSTYDETSYRIRRLSVSVPLGE